MIWGFTDMYVPRGSEMWGKIFGGGGGVVLIVFEWIFLK